MEVTPARCCRRGTDRPRRENAARPCDGRRTPRAGSRARRVAAPCAPPLARAAPRVAEAARAPTDRATSRGTPRSSRARPTGTAGRDGGAARGRAPARAPPRARRGRTRRRRPPSLASAWRAGSPSARRHRARPSRPTRRPSAARVPRLQPSVGSRGARPRLQLRVLQLAPELVVAADQAEVLLEAERVQHVGDRAERDARVAALDGAQRRSRHAGALGDERRRQLPTQARQPDVGAQRLEQALDRGQRRGRRTGHDGKYDCHTGGFCK